MRKKMIFMLLFATISCTCPELSEERLYGTWLLSKLHRSEVTKYNGNGFIKLNPDNTFSSNFSYFFYRDSLIADSALSGTWRIEYGCYQYAIEYQNVVVTVGSDYKTFSYSITDSTMVWGSNLGTGCSWERNPLN